MTNILFHEKRKPRLLAVDEAHMDGPPTFPSANRAKQRTTGSTRSSLYIDTANKNEIGVQLRMKGKAIRLKGKSKNLKAQQVLSLIAKGVGELGIKLKDIDCIKVNPGPGSFTGLRVGFAVANTIGWLLGVSVNQGKTGQPGIPSYK